MGGNYTEETRREKMDSMQGAQPEKKGGKKG